MNSPHAFSVTWAVLLIASFLITGFLLDWMDVAPKLQASGRGSSCDHYCLFSLMCNDHLVQMSQIYCIFMGAACAKCCCWTAYACAGPSSLSQFAALLESADREDQIGALDWLVFAPQLEKVSEQQLKDLGILYSLVRILQCADAELICAALLVVIKLESSDRSKLFGECGGEFALRSVLASGVDDDTKLAAATVWFLIFLGSDILSHS